MIIFWVGPDGGCGNCDIIQPPPAIITRHIISHQGYYFLIRKNSVASQNNHTYFKPSAPTYSDKNIAKRIEISKINIGAR